MINRAKFCCSFHASLAFGKSVRITNSVVLVLASSNGVKERHRVVLS
ncbi:MAG: hypothetical protein GY820_46130 [Gammaproteobacteria bacterium]|nr:hypothetical protein [Gammaproteobacteria bacterium]